MNRRSDILADLAGECLFFGGIIGALWFASYLYEVGFMAHFGVPVGLIEVGFSRVLAALLAAGPAAVFLAGVWLRFASHAGRGSDSAAFLPLCALGLLAAAGFALADDRELLTGALYNHLDLDSHVLKLAIFACLVTYMARFLDRCMTFSARGDFRRILLASGTLLLLIAIPIALGYAGGERKAASQRYFFYLADNPDFVLVRIYDDKVIFARRDRATGAFVPDFLVYSLADDPDILVTRRPPSHS